jgi:cell division protein ZapA (FtsZ GTPase activity inhibitor)
VSTTVKIQVLGHSLPLKVADHEVESIQRVGQFVDDTLSEFTEAAKNQPESLILILGAMRIAETLFGEQRKTEALQTEVQTLRHELESLKKESQEAIEAAAAQGSASDRAEHEIQDEVIASLTKRLEQLVDAHQTSTSGTSAPF